jgi:cell shape-determining protein MreD
MSMVFRVLLFCLWILLGLVCELGLPVWLPAWRFHPSTLDMALLLCCLTMEKGALVFWAGVIGLLKDLAQGSTIGPELITAATIGLAVACLRSGAWFSRSFLDQLLAAAVLLISLSLSRLVRMPELVTGPDFDPRRLHQFSGSLAITFLCVLLSLALWHLATILLHSNRERFESATDRSI